MATSHGSVARSTKKIKNWEDLTNKCCFISPWNFPKFNRENQPTPHSHLSLPCNGRKIGVGSCADDRGARLFFLKQFSQQFTPSHFALLVEEEQEGASDGIPSSDKIKLFAFLSLVFGHWTALKEGGGGAGCQIPYPHCATGIVTISSGD